ncbi:ankyrin repeat domain containing protein [Pandoravirus celtis]|uniref:Ankyrin repeat domain containing protein n=1 Tax=Pandoravirus celtis TaxID=2568002 RepID=A0A4D6EJH4_9VIRU|nr:ankyrin repeat domain containing protein [Pandoravirus celtis]
MLAGEDNGRGCDRQGMADMGGATHESTAMPTKTPRLAIKALPPEIVDLIFAHVDTAYGPAVDSVCRDWHQVWGGRHHFVDARPEIEWALRGHRHLLKWARSRGWVRRGNGIATAAAKNGHMKIIEWCLKHKLVIDADTAEALARGGHLDMLRRLHEHGCLWDGRVCLAAAKGGHLGLLQWAHKFGCRWTTAQLCVDAAAEHGHLHILEWISSEHGLGSSGRAIWDRRTCAAAAKTGRTELLQWLRANGCPWDSCTVSEAARHGHVDIVKWARANGCEWSETSCAQAAYSGDLDLLRWMRENGCPWDDRTPEYAALAGHIHILDWLCDQDCPHDHEYMAEGAAGSGQTAALDWLHAAGYAWEHDSRVYTVAASERQIAVLDWFRERRLPREQMSGAMSAAAAQGHIDVIKWMRARDHDWDKRACAEAASHGRLGTLRWLRHQGCLWDATVCEEAAGSGHLRVLVWAVEHGCPWDARACINLAHRWSGAKCARATEAWIMSQMCQFNRSF